jgi:tetratricopeptide (TPR) repeat protein
MIKSILIAIIGLGVLFSVQAAVAEEELPLPKGKNIKEWESISAALVAEKRFSEAMIYLDKILEQEPDNLKALTNKAGLLAQLGNFSKSLSLSNKVLDIEPDRISALTNKAIALKMLGEYEKSYQIFTKILMIDPENEKIKKSRAILLSGTPTISTNNSEYDVHVLVTIRDKDRNLIAVTESNNARYLPSQFTETWWSQLDKKEYISYENGFKKFQKSNTMISNDDHLGMLTLERVMHGYNVNVFEAFIPMIQMDETDTAEVQWTIIKN